jgi:hypothetical protein
MTADIPMVDASSMMASSEVTGGQTKIKDSMNSEAN